MNILLGNFDQSSVNPTFGKVGLWVMGSLYEFSIPVILIMNWLQLLVLLCDLIWATRDFPSGSDGRESACNAGDMALIPGSGRPTGERNGYPLQYSCFKSHGQRSLVGYSPRGCKESDVIERLTHVIWPEHFGNTELENCDP